MVRDFREGIFSLRPVVGAGEQLGETAVCVSRRERRERLGISEA